MLQLGQEKQSRLCLGESQRLGRWQEVCRLCGSGEIKEECQEKQGARLQTQTHRCISARPVANIYTCCTVKVLLGQTCIHLTWNCVTSQQQQQLSATFQSLRNSPAGPLPPFHHSDNVTSVTAPSCLHVSQQIQQHSPPIIPTSARSQPKTGALTAIEFPLYDSRVDRKAQEEQLPGKVGSSPLALALPASVLA